MGDDESSERAVAAATVWDAFRRGATSVGRSVAGAYRSIDPDVRRHAYQLPLVGLSALVPRPRVIEPLPPDGFRPVVFVHGLGGHPGNFFAMKTYFASRGRTRSYVVDFGNGSSFETTAAHLQDVIDEVFRTNELAAETQIDIVAHSMGGLISRLAADEMDCRRRIRKLVTLGTPHAGSYLARLAATEFTVELRPGSDTLDRLRSQDFWDESDGPRLTAFWSRADTVILPAESARFDVGDEIEVDVTHYGYLIRPSVWGEVWTALLP